MRSAVVLAALLPLAILLCMAPSGTSAKSCAVPKGNSTDVLKCGDCAAIGKMVRGDKTRQPELIMTHFTALFYVKDMECVCVCVCVCVKRERERERERERGKKGKGISRAHLSSFLFSRS